MNVELHALDLRHFHFHLSLASCSKIAFDKEICYRIARLFPLGCDGGRTPNPLREARPGRVSRTKKLVGGGERFGRNAGQHGANGLDNQVRLIEMYPVLALFGDQLLRAVADAAQVVFSERRAVAG